MKHASRWFLVVFGAYGHSPFGGGLAGAGTRAAGRASGGRTSRAAVPLPPGGLEAMAADRPVVKQFDKDGNGRLELAERNAAREWMADTAADRHAGDDGVHGPRRARRPRRDGGDDDRTRVRALEPGPARGA